MTDLRIHPTRISARGLALEGVFAPADLPRLADALANEEGELHYRITASLDARRRKVVSCIINGFVFLTCQTTLETFRHGVSIDDRLVLVDDESELPAIDEESDAEDYLVADHPLEIVDLIEDAVLLALPMVPRKPGLHEPGPGEGARATAARQSPFAALASLKRKK